MPMLRGLACLGVAAALLAAAGTARAQEGAGKAEARVVDYAGLAQEVLKYRGKVVYVDFWDTG